MIDKILAVLRSIGLLLIGIFVAALALGSFIYNSVYPDIGFEKVEVVHDNILLNVLVSVGLLVILFFLMRVLFARLTPAIESAVAKFSSAVILVAGFGFGRLFGNSSLLYDARRVFDFAHASAAGDVAKAFDAPYFKAYPFQVGMALYEEFFFRVFGVENTHIFTILILMNAILLTLFFYFLYKATCLLFDTLQVSIIVLVLEVTCLPAFMMCHFVYGLIPYMTLSMIAIYFQLKFLRCEKRWYYFVISAVAIGVAAVLKPNSDIWVIAMALLYIWELIKNFSWKKLLALGLAVFCVVTFPLGVKNLYAARTGEPVHEAMPELAYLAMGLQNEPVKIYPGWFNHWHYRFVDHVEKGEKTPLFLQKDGPEKVKARAKESIEESVHKYLTDPHLGFEFFKGKFLSEWENPNFGVYVYQRSIVEHKQMPRVQMSLAYGKLHTAASWFMNAYHLIVSVFALFGLWLLRRNGKLDVLIFAIIAYGGFLYHLLFEAKDMYTLPYFLILIPYAALGIYSLFELVNKKRTEKR
ncbi:MAG: hypothetical protein LBN08_04775 [Lactobacillales bacterium]|jgi:hypothetical protein|nr:hypothetical protein [Lactobacillales bacterium]